MGFDTIEINLVLSYLAELCCASIGKYEANDKCYNRPSRNVTKGFYN